MHPTALINGSLFFETYVARLGDVSVVDIGSQDVNGSLREVCAAGARYIGVDFEDAKGVDVVLTDPYSLPFSDASVDVVVSSSCFEHSEMFWVVFIEILRVLRPGGLFYLNVPANGWFHRYPVDCWRFYPDSGKALIAWARRCGIRAALLESYISLQHNDVWNDFVAVFVKDEARADDHPFRMLSLHKSFENGWIRGGDGIVNLTANPEDRRKVDELTRTLDREVERSERIAARAADVMRCAGRLEDMFARVADVETEAGRQDLEALRNSLGGLREILGDEVHASHSK